MIVTTSMYDIGDRKYIGIDDKKVKVPWRYNRPMISVFGVKTIFEYNVGDTIKAVIVNKTWGGENFAVLKSITD